MLLHGLEPGRSRSELQLGASPVSASGVVTDGVISTVSLPVGERSVLLDFLSKSNLLGERLYRSHITLY